MQRSADATLPRPAARHPPTATAEDAERSLVPVSDRVADLLKPTGAVPRYGDHGYEGDIEMWQPRHVTIADKLDLERQLASVDGALEPGNPGTVLARVHTLLAMYRDRDPLPTQVEAAIAESWLEDVGEYPDWVVAKAVMQWRRDPKRYRFKPLPGDIRLICGDIVGRLVTMRGRLIKLLGAIPRASVLPDRALDLRSRVVALAAAKRIP